MDFEDKKWSLFSSEEKEFLSEVFSKHEAIAVNFERYLSAAPESRLDMATQDLEKMPRTGWVRRNIPNPENIKMHTDYVEKYAFSEAPEGVNPYRCQVMASIHDVPEAIVTDFTPADPITKQEKAALEILAVKVIYQSSPRRAEIISLVKEYEEQKTPESQWVHDIDKLDPLFVALQYEGKYPEKMGIFKEFADYAGPRLKTDKGKSILQDLLENQSTYRQNHRDDFQHGADEKRGNWAGRR